MLLSHKVSVTLSIVMLFLGQVVSMAQTPQGVSLGKELYRATEASDLAKVKELIAQGADVNWHDKDGSTPLIVAAMCYQDPRAKEQEVSNLLGANARAGVAVSNGAVLSYTCVPKEVQIGVLKALLEAGADATGDDPKAGGGLALSECVIDDNLPCVQLLLDHGADPNSGAKRKSLILIEAVTSPVKGVDVSIVKALLAKGANPNFEDIDRNTAVSAALVEHDRAVAMSRLNGGREVHGVMVVDWKERANNYEEILDLLRAASAAMPKPEIKTLADAAAAGDLAKVNAFLADGADPKVKDGEGMTSLHLAVLRGHADVVRTLLKAGADVNARGQHGATPLMQATYQFKVDVVNILLEARPDLNAFDDSQQTALILAIYGNNLPTARLLLSHGADPNEHGESDITALIAAILSRNTEAVKLLRKAGAK